MGVAPELIGLAAVIMGSLVVLIPVAGITARFALRPMMDAWSKYREMKGNDDAVLMLERRMALMEEHINSIDRSVQHLREDADFRRSLESGAPARALPPMALPETPVV